LEKWAGEYPTLDKNNGFRPYPAGKAFFDDPNVLAAMRRTLPRKVVGSVLTAWGTPGTEPPIRKIDRYLVVFVCKSHQCGDHAIRLYFDLTTGVVQACSSEYSPEERLVVDTWYGRSEAKRLPSNACMGNGTGTRPLKLFGDTAPSR
jgi:hypothetical protein